MRLEQLEQIAAINQCRSVSQAAQKLFMTQPSLSRSVARLEEELGVTLFRRLPYGVEPTEAGQRVLEQAEHILQEIALLHDLAQKDQGLRGNVHLALSPVFYDLLAVELLLTFRQQFKEAHLVIAELTVMGVIEAVAKGKYDLGVTGYHSAETALITQLFEEQHLAYQAFAEVGFSLFVKKDHPLTALEAITFQKLIEWEMVFFDNTELALKKAGYSLQKKPMMVFDRATQKRIVAQSELAAIMPDIFAKNDSFTQVYLHQIPIIDGDALNSTIYFVHSADLPLSMLEKEIMTMIRQKYETLFE